MVAAAYMTLTERQHALLETIPIQHVIAQRGAVLWNQSFQEQLCRLATREGLLGELLPAEQGGEINHAPIVDTPLYAPPTQLNW